MKVFLCRKTNGNHRIIILAQIDSFFGLIFLKENRNLKFFRVFSWWSGERNTNTHNQQTTVLLFNSDGFGFLSRTDLQTRVVPMDEVALGGEHERLALGDREVNKLLLSSCHALSFQ